MSQDNGANVSIVKRFAQQLGIDNIKTIKKACEFSQLLDIRTSSSSFKALQLNGSSKTIICLELAAVSCGTTVDRTEAVKISGVNKKVYIGSLKAVESILELHDNKSIKDLAVQFGCTQAVTLAQQTLQRYEKMLCSTVDTSSPLFQVAALDVACRKLKVRVDRVKLKETCCVKKTTYSRLLTEMEKHADSLLAEKVITTKKTKTFLEEVEEKLNAESPADKPRKRHYDNDSEEETKENYAEWKKRILAKAAKS
ncbi:origin recognition complex subunit 6-like [Gigantopelta aegis]|uniref:origin recognition complex subunit 6-like n=1 Tax=Gigantopelta aegis TaxID=1735272 RepID=UPI001B888949|nr:origin recognition complex subunit 6-like [Gigantopelta aegis]